MARTRRDDDERDDDKPQPDYAKKLYQLILGLVVAAVMLFLYWQLGLLKYLLR